MNQYITGQTIKSLREQKKMTQSELAQKLTVSDKTVSKWETGRGFPDITLIDKIAEVFRVSVVELMSGNTVTNTNLSGNMLKSNFYVCPICNNVIYSVGKSVVICHGITLPPQVAEQSDESLNIEPVEDEYYVSVRHDMTRKHYISFIAAASDDGVQIVKLYPEGNAETRFKRSRIRYLYYFCNKDGLFVKKL